MSPSTTKRTKKSPARKQVRFGDIVEVRTPAGLAYLQYASKHPSYMDTVRVLPGLFPERPAPEKLEALSTHEGYFAFYLVSHAVRHGLAEVVAHYPIPAGLEAPRAILRPGFITREGTVTKWWLEEGTRETLLNRALTPEEKRLSLAEMWNHEFLVQRLSEQWHPEHEHAKRLGPAGLHTPHAATQGQSPRMRHYLYFPQATVGRSVAAELRRRGFTVESRQGADEKNWLVLVEHLLSPGGGEAISIREELEHLAAEHAGEYDGFETSLPE
ncbi:ribonuclease E inhibitor RraB [Hyalangium minutum]|uniref:ribonuclease E inhibitor RraB n=1 Tax=Hyalangium minutum TaxID=394096 RepID=UPI0012F92818|nr:ribonuclease E inhibitor RraB [Hyalangium minutum]